MSHKTFGVAALSLQVLLIILYAIATDYASSAEAGAAGAATTVGGVAKYYPFYQDVHVMIFVGFGFLMVFLKQYGRSSVALNMLLAALAVQMALLMNGFVHHLHKGHASEKIHMDIQALIKADFAAGAVLISFGAVLGRATPLQLLAMTVVEVVVFAFNEMLGAYELSAVDMGGSMFVHTFGAMFGLSTSFMLERLSAKGTERDEQRNGLEAPHRYSDKMAMIGTLFLFMFWPSFNGALADGAAQHRVVINTVIAITASGIAGFAVSALMSHGNHFDMVHIQNATLAGGVAVGSSADLVIEPWGALLIGMLAGTLSVVGYMRVSPNLKAKYGLLDTCGVLNLHGMPGIMGGIGGVIAAAAAGSNRYGQDISAVFPARASVESGGKGWSAGEQSMHQLYALLVTVAFALIGGWLAGLIMSRIGGMRPRVWFDDNMDWEALPTSSFEEHAAPELQQLSATVRELTAQVQQLRADAERRKEAEEGAAESDVRVSGV